MDYTEKSLYPVLESHCSIRRNHEGYYLSSLLHRSRVQLDDQQSHALTYFDGARSLADILQCFDSGSRKNLLNFLLNLHAYDYLVCYDAPRPARPVALPDTPAPHLQEVHLDITGNCNLRCKHCYQAPYLEENLGGKEMDTDEWLGVLDQLGALGVDRVNISGGEPLLRPDLLKIIDGIFRRGIRLSSVFSNGTTPLEPLLEFFHARPFPVDFSISLDGPDRESHETIRGPDTFERTMENIRRLVDLVRREPTRYSFDVNTCVFTSNVGKLQDMYDLVKALGVPRWRISLPRDEGLFKRNRRKLEVESQNAFAAYKKLVERYLEDFDNVQSGVQSVVQPDSPSDAPLNALPYLQIESIFRTSILLRREVVVFTPQSSCCEYKRYGLAIKPNGDVLSCTSFHTRKMGNLRHRGLRETWYDPENQYLKRFPLADVAGCRDCELLQYCGTGCRANALERTGDIHAKDEPACRVYEFFNHDILPILRDRGVKLVTA